MITIHKYQLEMCPFTKISFPGVCRFLSLQVQKGVACMWMEVDDQCEEMIEHTIFMVGTGREVPKEANTYLGTVQFGPYVFHYYTNRSANFLR